MFEEEDFIKPWEGHNDNLERYEIYYYHVIWKTKPISFTKVEIYNSRIRCRLATYDLDIIWLHILHPESFLDLTFKSSFDSSHESGFFPRSYTFMSFYQIIHSNEVQYIGMHSGGSPRI